MTLPISHPFWPELIVVLAVTAFTALFVHARAHRIVAEEVVSDRGIVRVRRDMAVTAASLALVAGLLASILFLRWFALSRPLATWAFLVFGLGAALFLSVSAIVLGARRRMRGSLEMVVLTLVWAAAYGYLLPTLTSWWVP
jgi:hypothetical protein